MTIEVRPRRVLQLLAFVCVGVPVAVLVLCMFAVAALLFAPVADDLVGGTSANALALVQSHREHGRSVKELVAERYRNPRWYAFHRDYLEETYVRCDAVTRAGNPTGLVWIVITEPKLRGLRPTVAVTATAHNRAAYEIAPTLYEKGHTLYASPDIANW